MAEHLSDELLASLAEGEGDPASNAHVGACAPCRSRLEAVKKVSLLLESYAPASRNLCPDRHMLADRGKALEAHLAACPLCREDLLDLAVLEAAPRFVLAVKFARGLVELVENALGELLPRVEPALARGGAAASAVVVRRDLGGGAVLEVALAPGREGVDVLVTLAGAARFRVELVRAGKILEGRESEEGRVLLDGVAPGDYELLVHGAGAQPVEVRLGVMSP